VDKSKNATLALDTILQKSTQGIPTYMIHLMEHAYIEQLAGANRGDYKESPEEVYLSMQRAIGTCLLDQYIPDNPLKMSVQGYVGPRGVTTGISRIVQDGILIDSPEAVVEHMERIVFPRIIKRCDMFDEKKCIDAILEDEAKIQQKLGSDILKSGYGFLRFPHFRYQLYGYENYFMAYALYPDIMEKDFSLQADYALLNNTAAAHAYVKGSLPPLYRLDHDMADSRGTLVDIESLDRLWFPHFSRCLEPIVKGGIKLIWHCDGNLMHMVPRLLEVGIRGFQGFQYEDGMDYKKICRMKSSRGENLVIIAGISVTQTLPKGKPDDVMREMTWLVENGPKTGLFLAVSSSITPGVRWENIETLIEGLTYFRTHGRP
jgi:hypothetical protein